MADPISIRITNLPQIKAAFGRSPLIMGRNLNLAIQRTLLTIKGRSMINTPVDTGRLRASTYTISGNLKGEIGTRTNYDMFVHEGTRFMRARPYLRNAVNASSSDTERFFVDAVDKTLSEIGSMT